VMQKREEMGGACGKTWGKETTWKTQAQTQG
jgi:hypothetical protein